ncbi:MAG: thioredoxin [Verrucomicrobiota bacterium]
MKTTGLDPKGIHLKCASCGQINRVAFDQLDRSNRCGKCKADLPKPSEPFDLNSEAEFDAVIESSSLPVLVDFWAAWCGPCKMVAPEFARIARAHAGAWLVAKVDTEHLPDLAARFRISGIPTFVLFQNGREIGRSSGARPASQIEAFVRESLGG